MTKWRSASPPLENIKVRLVRRGALAAVFGLLIMMMGPFQGAEREVGLTDKPAHALAFAAITAAIFLNWLKASRLQAAGLAFLIGAPVELVQALSGRDPEVGDLRADAIGIAIVAVLCGAGGSYEIDIWIPRLSELTCNPPCGLKTHGARVLPWRWKTKDFNKQEVRL
ncbi:hypothetical protein BH10PSE1_BH10PSE1_26040 [soil metagenome]